MVSQGTPEPLNFAEARARRRLDDVEAGLERANELLERIRRERWLGPVSGALPRFPTRDALPAAAEEYRGRVVLIEGDGSTTADVVYVCLQDALGAYAWEIAATG